MGCDITRSITSIPKFHGKVVPPSKCFFLLIIIDDKCNRFLRNVGKLLWIHGDTSNRKDTLWSPFREPTITHNIPVLILGMLKWFTDPFKGRRTIVVTKQPLLGPDLCSSILRTSSLVLWPQDWVPNYSNIRQSSDTVLERRLLFHILPPETFVYRCEY